MTATSASSRRRLPAPARSRSDGACRSRAQRGLGWLFSAPAFIGLLVFVAIPIVLTAWVSLRDWSGLVSPFNTEYIGFENYNELLFEDGVRRTDFALSIRNNFYYVLFVVPMQTTIAFVLAVILNNKFLKGKGFFRTSYYFPSITSSIAVTLIFCSCSRPRGRSTPSSPARRSTGSTTPTACSTTPWG